MTRNPLHAVLIATTLALAAPAMAETPGTSLGTGDPLGHAIFAHYEQLATRDATLRTALSAAPPVDQQADAAAPNLANETPARHTVAIRIGFWVVSITSDTSAGAVHFDWAPQAEARHPEAV